MSPFLLTRNMIKFCFICVLLFHIFAIIDAEKSGCLEREKALTSLDIAEDLLSKLKDAFPSCKDDLNSTTLSECSKEKPLAYIEIIKKMISDVRENFPVCSKAIVPDDKPRDCFEILMKGNRASGVYMIWPREPFTTGNATQVYCDMKTEGGGWTLIQRRGKFPVQQDFNLDWETYKNGFGNITEEFWLGNENIRILCHKGCTIRFDLQDEKGMKKFADYESFYLTNSNYQIHISNFTGNAGDAMKYHDGKEFSTKDRDTTGRAKEYQSGWWHRGSNYCNPNGVYQPGTKEIKSVNWFGVHGNWENLAAVEIKVKPN